MFMLRKHASPQEGWSGSVGGEAKVSLSGRHHLHAMGTNDIKQQNLPGGVL